VLGDKRWKCEEVAHGSREDGRRKYWEVTNENVGGEKMGLWRI
jgi:hypothetical protein